MNQPIPQYEDLKCALETAVKEREIEIAKNFKKLGLSNDDIARGTVLPVEQIEKL